MLRVAFLLIVAVAAMLLSWEIVTTDKGLVHIEWFGTQIDTSGLICGSCGSNACSEA